MCCCFTVTIVYHDIHKIMKCDMFDERMVWLGAKSAIVSTVQLIK